IPAERGAAELAVIIDEVRPDVIVTFGPDGMTGHPDHRAISAWTDIAWRLAGSRGALWYATLTPEFHREWGELNMRVGLWMDDVAGPSTDRADRWAEIRMSGRLLARKNRALRAHASQTRSLEALVGRARYKNWWSAESFVAATPPARSRGTETMGAGFVG